jgi:hypothetical protein
MKARTLLLSLVVFLFVAADHVATHAQEQQQPQEAAAGAEGVEVLGFSWSRERIRPRPSMSSLASPEELVRQSQREAQLAAARNSANKGAAGRIETQKINEDEAMAKARQTAPPDDGYRYKVKVKNNGGKTVKSVDWDYLFIDPLNGREVARHQFTSDDTIKPGKSKDLEVLYLTAPVKTISAAMLKKKEPMPFREQVQLMRILYSDGSVWQRP